jgi:hypothetical protein
LLSLKFPLFLVFFSLKAILLIAHDIVFLLVYTRLYHLLLGFVGVDRHGV